MQVEKAEAGLARDGYAVLSQFIPSSEIPTLRALVEARLTQPVDASCVRPHNTLVPLRWNDPLVEQILAQNLQPLREVTRARDLRWISGYISIKDPHSPPLWWHQDWWCWDHPISFQIDPAQVAVLCYLTETTPENGALRVLPGTHHRSAPIHAVLPEAHARAMHDLPDDHVVLQDQPGQVTLSLQLGDAVVADYRLLHGTHANRSNRRRDCIVLNFTPSWDRLPDDIRGHLIQHTALPAPGERAASPYLPAFQGERRDLRLNRNAPTHFKAEFAARVVPRSV